MVSSIAASEQDRNQLIKAYRKLPSLEQVIVQLFSVIYDSISRSLLINCWNGLPEKLREGKHFTTPSIKPYVDRLIEAKVLIQQSGYGPQCNPLLVEVATRDAVKAKRFEAMVKAVETGFPMPRRWKDGPISFGNDRQLIRQIRIDLYRNDLKAVNQHLEDYYKYSYQKDKLSVDDIYLLIFNNPFDPEWFCSLPPELYENGLFSILNHPLMTLSPADEAFSLLQASVNQAGQQRPCCNESSALSSY